MRVVATARMLHLWMAHLAKTYRFNTLTMLNFSRQLLFVLLRQRGGARPEKNRCIFLSFTFDLCFNNNSLVLLSQTGYNSNEFL